MDATWLALAAVLGAIGVLWTIYAYRTRGVASALRGAGLTALVPAAYLTGTLELAGEIAVDVGDFASGIVFSPVVWTGIAIGGAGILLFLMGGLLAARGVGTTPRASAEGGRTSPDAPAARPRKQVGPAPASRSTPAADDGMDDIEALLRRRGIE